MRALLIILALAFSSTVAAFPSQNSNCTGCHDANTGVGSIAVDQTSPIDVLIGDTATVTFSLSGIPTPTDGDSGAIALFGMDAAGLDAIIGTPDNWTFNSGVDNPFVSDSLNNTDNGASSYTLTFDVGSSATLGTYLIDVILAGDDADVSGDTRWYDATSFSVNVAAIPVPAAVWLFGSGLLGLVGVARRRRRNA
jgi:hypothetical protein